MSKNFVEVHGRIRYARCTLCDHFERWDTEEKAQKNLELPLCPNCENQIIRPDVVWFGEQLPSEKWNQAVEWTLQANIMLVIGTSGVVVPVASLPAYARQHNVLIIEFNIEETPISSVSDFSVYGPCEITLPEFVNRIIEYSRG